MLSYRVSGIKRSDFGDVLKIGKWGFSGVKCLLLTAGFPPTFLDCILGHRRGASTVLT
jgi:hypothetical protein